MADPDRDDPGQRHPLRAVRRPARRGAPGPRRARGREREPRRARSPSPGTTTQSAARRSSRGCPSTASASSRRAWLVASCDAAAVDVPVAEQCRRGSAGARPDTPAAGACGSPPGDAPGWAAGGDQSRWLPRRDRGRASRRAPSVVGAMYDSASPKWRAAAAGRRSPCGRPRCVHQHAPRHRHECLRRLVHGVDELARHGMPALRRCPDSTIRYPSRMSATCPMTRSSLVTTSYPLIPASSVAAPSTYPGVAVP